MLSITPHHNFTYAQSYWIAMALNLHALFIENEWDMHTILNPEKYKRLFIQVRDLNDLARELSGNQSMHPSNLSTGVHALSIKDEFPDESKSKAAYRLKTNSSLRGRESIKDITIAYKNQPHSAIKVKDLFKWVADVYVPVINSYLAPRDNEYPQEDPVLENMIQRKYGINRTRSIKHMIDAKARDNFTCVVCGFHFNGKIVEAHHLNPLSETDEPRYSSPKDIVTLCPNCHRIAHLLWQSQDLHKKDKLIAEIKKAYNTSE